jgi:hypothetical protein
VFRILALTMVGVLLQTASLSANCLEIPTFISGTVIEGSSNSPDGAVGEAGCCAFCCHFTGVATSPNVTLRPVADGFIEADGHPLTLDVFMKPFDRPPRA